MVESENSMMFIDTPGENNMMFIDTPGEYKTQVICIKAL